ncbi:polysaccharide biosynthesis protein [Bacillus sp. DX4.1]|uniref:putative polysaccharide biosynthesis protein n=1 Tax=Bacillus sp. DX4.1 TaxID=3055867 RepID=UPI0025A16664|nr:polysaccharide biosynthesis protein [Bacillus sp. DX4.1]MDM5190382.1 polysaccharide biosynthesis protein [Bacillus sp. DX4.1]
MSDSKFLRGTLIVTLGTFLVKFLGMIYVFPFHALVGTEGGTLYTYGYIPYTIFLSIATAGVPLAVSKFVSKYNALGDYKTSRRMFRSGMIMMIITGILSFLVLYMTAPLFAEAMLGKKSLHNSIEDVTMIIRLVSFALIVVPAASLIRGYFQGHQSMGPTTVSQIIEQIIRIVFLLAGSFIVIKVIGGSVAAAVGVATFAAFISAVGALGVLIWYWMKRKNHLDQYLIEQTAPESTVSTVQLFKELFAYAIPYVVVGLTIPLYQQIDTLTFNSIMQAIGQGDIAERALGIFTMWTHKLIMIPVSLATAFSLTLVPAITKSFTERQFRYLKLQITQTFQANMFLTLPAVVGISTLAYPIYTAFYEADPLGGQILMWYAPVALLFALFTVTAAILQGINQQKHAIIALGMGVILKFLGNVVLIRYFGPIGAVVATGVGFLASIWYTNKQIRKYAHYSFGVVYKRTFQIAVLTVTMVIAVKLSGWMLSFILPYETSRFAALVTVAVCAIFGAGVYGYLALRTGVLERVFGGEFLEKIQRKLGGKLKLKIKAKGA